MWIISINNEHFLHCKWVEFDYFKNFRYIFCDREMKQKSWV